ncbi:MAG: formylglycine-generating enzyme family protein [Candidatus Kapabacteria bacterium]|nr:formylglycine-generating enzyme family protein [Candidatus Kapabacteria bacterium]
MKNNDNINIINCVENALSDTATVLIPAGTFQMGNTGFSGDLSNETPVHKVIISRAFYIGKYKVTQGLWKSVMGNNPSDFKGDNRPVEHINWFEAIEFCNKKSKIDGFSPCYTINGINVTCDWNANGWRLPTEAESEYTCKGGTSTDFYSGNMRIGLYSLADTNLDKIGWYFNNSYSTTHPCGLKLPNNFGVYDMTGNVDEWCWDWWGFYNSGTVYDPKGPNGGVNKILRGGTWYDNPAFCRSSFRWKDNPNEMGGLRHFDVKADYYYSYGVRIVRVKF